ncbi:retrovirus-related Pol polyprotein from transposon 17.6 [Trichonephila clavipes]|nr:retrovirus-related Pol polyprotein from transposon 17.6 [Trichonephila clavipes]
MKIILSEEKPIAQRSRRLSLPEQQEVKKQIDEWLEQGIIRESCSDFSSPVVSCKKKEGTMRLSIDYRKLNKKIINDRYPLPIIEEVLDKLANKRMQEENGRTYHRKRKKAQYQKKELVATMRTQFGNKMKPWTLH